MSTCAIKVRFSPLFVLDHLHTPALAVLPALVLTGVPFAPGRYFATSATLIRAQGSPGRLVYRACGTAGRTTRKTAAAITVAARTPAVAPVIRGLRRAQAGSMRDQRPGGG